MSEPVGWTERSIQRSAYLRGRIGWQGLRAEEFRQEGPYLVTGTDFDCGRVDWSRCYHVSEERFREAVPIQLRDGDLLITKDGTIGKIAYVQDCPEQAVLNSGVFLLRCSDGSFQHRFLYHVLNSHHFVDFLLRNLAGSTINHLYQYVFEQFSFVVPEDEQQERICRILDLIDTQIEATATLIAKQERVRAGLMQDLFTRGVDEHGQLRPPREQASHLYHQAELGWLPLGWNAPLLDRVANRVSGHTPSRLKPEYWNGGVKWVSLADSSRLDRPSISETTHEISQLGIQNSSAQVHPAGTVLVSRDAGVGKSSIMAEPMAVSQHFIAWICRGKLNNLFLYYYLQYNKRLFENIASGSTIVTIGLDFFKRMRIALPDDTDEQKEIANVLKAVDDRLDDEKAALSKLRLQKTGLMEDLLSGKVSVASLLEGSAA